MSDDAYELPDLDSLLESEIAARNAAPARAKRSMEPVWEDDSLPDYSQGNSSGGHVGSGSHNSPNQAHGSTHNHMPQTHQSPAPTYHPPTYEPPVEEIELPSFSVAMGKSIDELLKRVVDEGASDLHLSCNSLPRYRVDGDLIPMAGETEVQDDWLKSQIRSIASDHLWKEYLDTGEVDLSYAVEGYGRFRVNVFVQRGTSAAVMRTIPTEIKTIAQLGVPESLNDIIKKPKGLILVTGPTGSGKSTTLTAMIDAINSTRKDHIVTIEDPIEFVHTNKMSLVNQREVGSDTQSFGQALKRVLRQDPDVILIGEMRDAETISTALTAAETGHLVFGTLHTQSASKTIDRIIDTFEPAQQSQVRSQLSDTLQAVISQSLVKKIGGGRVAATEILIRNSAIANNIREGNIAQIYSAIQTGTNLGMHTLDQDLKRLVKAGLIDKEEVMNMLIDKKSLDGVSAVTNDWGY